jgi:hypothetical protein
MRPYWIKIDHPMSRGVGITANSEDDARTLFRLAWPTAYKIMSIEEIVDMRDVDQDHVAPNMGNCLRRGIWFPIGYGHITN